MGLQSNAQSTLLLRYIINFLLLQDEHGSVSKDQLLNYIARSPEVLELYDLNPGTLKMDIYSFPSKARESLSFDEFLAFLKNPKAAKLALLDSVKSGHRVTFAKETIKLSGTDEPIRMIETADTLKRSPPTQNTGKSTARSSETQEQTKNPCLLSEEILYALREIFEDADKYGDFVVARSELLEKVRADVRIIRNLQKPAVYLPDLDKKLTLERILIQIEQEEKGARGDLKKAREYLSLNQFMKYFTDYHVPHASPAKHQEERATKKP